MARDLNGEWRGQYAYAPAARGAPDAVVAELDAASRRAPVPFTMSLRQGLWWRVRGTASDAGPFALPGTCDLEGIAMGRRVRFTKTYPAPPMTIVDGVPTLVLDVLRKVAGDEMCAGVTLPRNRVHYVGTLDESGSILAGTWEIRPRLVRFPRARKLVRLGVQMTGSWSASRID